MSVSVPITGLGTNERALKEDAGATDIARVKFEQRLPEGEAANHSRFLVVSTRQVDTDGDDVLDGSGNPIVAPGKVVTVGLAELAEGQTTVSDIMDEQAEEALVRLMNHLTALNELADIPMEA